MIEAPGFPCESLTKLSSTQAVYFTRTPLNWPTWCVTAHVGAGAAGAADAADAAVPPTAAMTHASAAAHTVARRLISRGLAITARPQRLMAATLPSWRRNPQNSVCPGHHHTRGYRTTALRPSG